MGKVNVFNFTTLNGFFQGKDRDVSWAHETDQSEFASKQLATGDVLLFGRVTYEEMASFWPTEVAREKIPDLARGMNAAEKVVFSRTLKKAEWTNARVASNLEGEVARLKKTDKNMTVLGSGSIVTQLAQAGLVDEYSIMVHPVVLGAGTPMFQGLQGKLRLRLESATPMSDGTVFLRYVAASKR